jgi:hypothetical protein
MNRIPLRKAAIGVGFAGMLLFGANLAASRRSRTEFKVLTPPENANLVSVPELHSALERLQVYSVLDTKTFNYLLVQCSILAYHSAQPPNVANVRSVDNASIRINTYLRTLRERVKGQSTNHDKVMEEFDEVASAVKEACESQSFNIHQRLHSF